MPIRRSCGVGTVAILLIVAVPAIAGAQGAKVDQTQLGAPDDGSLTVQQLSEPGQRILNPFPAARPTAPIAQVSVPGAPRQPMAQVTSERRDAAPPTQLSSGGTAEAPAPLSRPSEGRTGAVAAIRGRDRCDPARRIAVANDCANVIENRSVEFARPNPLTLSPEQRLLVDQRLREANAASQRTPVVRPGDATQANPDTPEGQAVAALVRDQTRPDDRKSPVDTLPSGIPDGAQAVIEAIINNGGQSPR